jgi:hypothetical protein
MDIPALLFHFQEFFLRFPSRLRLTVRVRTGILPGFSSHLACPRERLSPHFSPRVWKGGASAPPLQGLSDHFLCSVPRAARGRKLRGVRDQQRVGAAISAGLKPRPSGSPLRASKRGEKSGLGHPGRTAT